MFCDTIRVSRTEQGGRTLSHQALFLVFPHFIPLTIDDSSITFTSQKHVSSEEAQAACLLLLCLSLREYFSVPPFPWLLMSTSQQHVVFTAFADASLLATTEQQ